jgi:phage protein U
MTEYRQEGDSIAGDQIRVSCMKPEQWILFQKSGQHKGSYCIAKKDAKAKILKAYTNIKK